MISILTRRFLAAPAKPQAASTSTSIGTKSVASIVSKLRKDFEGIPLSKITSAVKESQGNYDKARAWLMDQLKEHATSISHKVKDRAATEGWVISAQRPGIGSVLLKINCETDFVARGEMFQSAASDIASTALLLQNTESFGRIERIETEELLRKPLVHSDATVSSSKHVHECVMDLMAKTREKVTLSDIWFSGEKQSYVEQDNGSSAAVYTCQYVHGAYKKFTTASEVRLELGKIGCLCVFRCSVGKEPNMERNITDEGAIGHQIAQHIVGMNSDTVEGLLNEPFLFNQEKTVREVIEDFKYAHNLNSFDIQEFKRISTV